MPFLDGGRSTSTTADEWKSALRGDASDRLALGAPGPPSSRGRGACDKCHIGKRVSVPAEGAYVGHGKAADAREGLFDSVKGRAKEVAGARSGKDDLVEGGGSSRQRPATARPPLPTNPTVHATQVFGVLRSAYDVASWVRLGQVRKPRISSTARSTTTPTKPIASPEQHGALSSSKCGAFGPATRARPRRGAHRGLMSACRPGTP